MPMLLELFYKKPAHIVGFFVSEFCIRVKSLYSGFFYSITSLIQRHHVKLGGCASLVLFLKQVIFIKISFVEDSNVANLLY